ncbi:AraC family transcriptional regulator [Saccharibacillus brassicae]|uniref:AraC family transcriptional regulator n=1 Tax=Saccharibacillus brassicae TaxID=2583377 RepID=A0A4Y6UVV3_SACBS|nr:AraC family transcriptional regulator [Saccharibacillus brassicae]QDH20688.1 AraC family transcriptional regulator [Saccharibacillus brassicae]
MIEYLPRSKLYTQLYLTQFGMEDCLPGHDFGPAVRTHYLFHYVFEGEGLFEVDGAEYRLAQGEGFLICPHVVTYYRADRSNPWSYGWIGFNGTLAETLLAQAGLTSAAPVLRCGHNDRIRRLLQEMAEPCADRKARETRLTGLLYLALSLLVECGTEAPRPSALSRAETYAEQVKDFIEMNFSSKFGMEDVAASIGLNRSYLCALFTRETGTSIQDYLIRYRIDTASAMLGNTDLSIGDIARSVGYADPLVFSKAFKKITGKSPKSYRDDLPTESDAESDAESDTE